MKTKTNAPSPTEQLVCVKCGHRVLKCDDDKWRCVICVDCECVFPSPTEPVSSQEAPEQCNLGHSVCVCEHGCDEHVDGCGCQAKDCSCQEYVPEAPMWCFEAALGVIGFIAGGKAHPETIAELIAKHWRGADSHRVEIQTAGSSGPAEWRDIESAPKDGSYILLANEDDVSQGYWDREVEAEGGQCWLLSDPDMQRFEIVFESAPTSWQPLPAPPADSEGEK